MCYVIKSWAADVPADALAPVLQLLRGLLLETCPKAVRLAALGPLRSLLDRFSDHEAWAEAQGPLIDGCLALLGVLRLPEVQWRCLNLVHLFLCEEAESGRYEVTERSLQQLLQLWRQPDQGELLICHALLDVLRALVLMACRSKLPRLPLSPPLLSCCLGVISDCYANHRVTVAVSCNGTAAHVDAALEADAAAAAGRLGDHASASATLFDSGSALFLGVLRTVEVSQAGPLLNLLPRLVSLYGEQPAAALHENALDILLELCTLAVAAAPSAAPLRPHSGTLAILCQRCLQSERKGRNCEISFQLLQMLLAHADGAEGIRQLRDVAVPLFHHWSTSFNPQANATALEYPLHSVLQLFCTWHAHHIQDFKQHAKAMVPNTARVAALLLAGCKLVRPTVLKTAVLCTCLSLIDDGGADDGFWREFLQSCDDLIACTQKKGASALLSQTLQSLKSSLATKLPVPLRSSGELQCCLLPAELRQALREDGSLDEVAVVRWFFEQCAHALRQLSVRCGLSLQALLAAAPEQVQSALRASGL
mmetsp:Transcript_94589/g.294215  ORF Transcript_94589/g.294215 Transcript_94589/m.294215 type:complete len:537 (+) Transcript_94589:1-1611(+)